MERPVDRGASTRDGGTAPFALRASPNSPPAGSPPPSRRWRHFVLAALVGAGLVKLLIALTSGGTPGALVSALDRLASVVLIGTLLAAAVVFVMRAQRRMLWRVRRKLALSYVLIGVVPVLLVVLFFAIGGLLMFFHISAYLFRDAVDDLIADARLAARATALELGRAGDSSAAERIMRRRLDALADEFPGASMVLMPWPGTPQAPAVSAGPWRHMAPPDRLPEWVEVPGVGGLIVYAPIDAPDETHLLVRTVGTSGGDPAYAVLFDVPAGAEVLTRLRQVTGVEADTSRLELVDTDGRRTEPAPGRPRSELDRVELATSPGGGPDALVNSVTFVDYLDWETGATGTAALATRFSIAGVYQRVASAQSPLADVSLGELALMLLMAIAGLFFVIEAVAFGMGFALARSITGSVHELFVGTERVRSGDFSHRIRVKARDQLGELAESFNEMTAGVERLLQESKEKRRLAEELRIAREIQASLLPRGIVHVPGLTMAALSVPAREVGGDYYDVFRLGERRMALLIADVSGKGTSAELYMAELKGVVLSLSQIYDSPKRLLVEVNRIISDHLDTRSFITMIYAVVDLGAGTLTYARAGHTPLIHASTGADGEIHAESLVPGGLVLGLRIPGVTERFASLLEEATLPLRAGDVFVFYTDGVTEAMNVDLELFGEDRLRALVSRHARLSSEELRERIVREVDAFVGPADPSDDMTMILLKVDRPMAGVATLAARVAASP